MYGLICSHNLNIPPNNFFSKDKYCLKLIYSNSVVPQLIDWYTELKSNMF